MPSSKAHDPSHASRLDPRAMIALLFGYSVAAFLATSPWGLLALAALLFVALAVLRVSLRDVLRMGMAAYVLVASIVVLNGLSGLDGWRTGLMMGARILLVLWASATVVLGSTSTQLQRGLAGLLAPLRPLGLPVDDIAMTLSLALRLMPEVSAAFSAVQAAQASRGAHLVDGGPVRRAQAWGAVFAATLGRLFRNADALASAMDARCYGLAGIDGGRIRRTQLSTLRWRAADTFATMGAGSLIAACAVLL